MQKHPVIFLLCFGYLNFLLFSFVVFFYLHMFLTYHVDIKKKLIVYSVCHLFYRRNSLHLHNFDDTCLISFGVASWLAASSLYFKIMQLPTKRRYLFPLLYDLHREMEQMMLCKLLVQFLRCVCRALYAYLRIGK